mmetsp:Transcript_29693/g.88097  ORF Transcript_29693/g.88097 Transcript_29693/m.88097 type:complete len:266 (-) Transcript_29693:1065-1862(-)
MSSRHEACYTRGRLVRNGILLHHLRLLLPRRLAPLVRCVHARPVQCLEGTQPRQEIPCVFNLGPSQPERGASEGIGRKAPPELGGEGSSVDSAHRAQDGGERNTARPVADGQVALKDGQLGVVAGELINVVEGALVDLRRGRARAGSGSREQQGDEVLDEYDGSGRVNQVAQAIEHASLLLLEGLNAQYATAQLNEGADVQVPPLDRAKSRVVWTPRRGGRRTLHLEGQVKSCYAHGLEAALAHLLPRLEEVGDVSVDVAERCRD